MRSGWQLGDAGVLGYNGGMKRQLMALVLGALAGRLWAVDYPSEALRRAREDYFFAAPATHWTASIPIGNGRLGALLPGSVAEERIFLNEESVWAPQPPQPVNRTGAALVGQLRELLFAGREAEAAEMCEQDFLRGPDAVAPYVPVGALRVRHTLPAGEVQDYRRGADLLEGVAYTAFRAGEVSYRREAYAAYTADVLVFTYEASQPGALSFTLSAEHPSGFEQATVLAPNQLYACGSTGANGVAFDLVAEVRVEGGDVVAGERELAVQGATRAVVCVAIVTDFNRLAPGRPLTRCRLSACRAQLNAFFSAGEKTVRAAHGAAFSALFCRSYVCLAGARDGRPVEVRLAEAKASQRWSPDFLLLNVDFCRYLLISSSRVGGLPATLQGKWNPLTEPPWKSDWHLDINLSMFYWAAGAWGLGELAEPLLSLAELTFPKSRSVAREMLGVEEGAFLGTCTDLWGSCAPFRFACWGMTVSGGAWLLQDVLLAARDSATGEAMRVRLLPLLREQVRFYLGWLVRRPGDGRWVSGPAMSPENTYLTPAGASAIDMGPAYEQEMVAATLRDFIVLAEALTPEDPLIARAAAVYAELAPPQIAPDGALQEWSRPYAEAEPAHRHLSFAYALMPGRAWSLRRTPALAEAVRLRLDGREAAGHHAMGWSLGHMACLRARLRQPEEALRVLDLAPGYLTENLFTTSSGQAQVADLGGVPAALHEMLLQSDGEVLHILPALPERFRQAGAFRLTARDGLVIEAAWQEGALTRLTLTAAKAGSYTLHTPHQRFTLRLAAGERKTLQTPNVR